MKKLVLSVLVFLVVLFGCIGCAPAKYEILVVGQSTPIQVTCSFQNTIVKDTGNVFICDEDYYTISYQKRIP